VKRAAELVADWLGRRARRRPVCLPAARRRHCHAGPRGTRCRRAREARLVGGAAAELAGDGRTGRPARDGTPLRASFGFAQSRSPDLACIKARRRKERKRQQKLYEIASNARFKAAKNEVIEYIQCVYMRQDRIQQVEKRLSS